jgi:hypothetical protein
MDADGQHVWYVEQSRGIDWIDTQTRTPISAVVDEVATLMRPAPVATPPPPPDPAVEKERTRLHILLAEKRRVIAEREAKEQAKAREARAAAEHAKRVETTLAIISDAATTDAQRAEALAPMVARHFQVKTKTNVQGQVTHDGHIALFGDTYPNSDTIKASVQQHGGTWDPVSKRWLATPAAVAHMMGMKHAPNAQDHARAQAKAEATRVASERAAAERQAQQAEAARRQEEQRVAESQRQARQAQYEAEQKKTAHAALDASLPEHLKLAALKGKTVALYQDGHAGGAGVVKKHEEAIRRSGAGFEPSQRRWTLRIPSRGDGAQAIHTLIAGISKAGGRVEVLS